MKLIKVGQARWRDYLIEAWGLAMILMAAGFFTVAFEDPGSPLALWLPNPWLRRAGIGLLMALTVMALIYSPWGKRSGAHFNPAVSLTFYRLGKLNGWDTAFYGLSQLCGGLVGVLVVAILLRERFTTPPIQYITTVPGFAGSWVAFGVEFVMSAGLMGTVLWTVNSARYHQWTGALVGILVGTYITLFVPLSGMSINPARTLASAWPANVWTGWWIYLLAPCLGMLAVAEVYLAITRKPTHTLCVKLCPNAETPCGCALGCAYGCGLRPSGGHTP
ncbi:MAG: aquaporin [Synechococcales cyanobacterium]